MLPGKKHLDEAGKGYFAHFFFALKWGLFLVCTGLISIVHGIFPFLWKFTASQNVMKVARMIESRGNPKELGISNQNLK